MIRLRARDLHLQYDGRSVLRGIDLSLAGGELVGLLGPNGAGKTTLLRACAGLLMPQAGVIEFEARPLDDVPRRELAQAVAFIASGAPCHWPVEVERLIALGRLPHLSPWTAPGPEDRAAIAEAMDLTDAAAFRGRPATELSDGERARVMLARALAGQPRLLLADEPVSGLDPRHQLTVMEVLAEQARRGGSVVVTLHDLGLAARFCDRVLVLDNGGLVADGKPTEVLDTATLAGVFGIRALRGQTDGVPYLIPWAPTDSDGAKHG